MIVASIVTPTSSAEIADQEDWLTRIESGEIMTNGDWEQLEQEKVCNKRVDSRAQGLHMWIRVPKGYA
jgi:hypothetical protein